jgi:hypothetical protein
VCEPVCEQHVCSLILSELVAAHASRDGDRFTYRRLACPCVRAWDRRPPSASHALAAACEEVQD